MQVLDISTVSTQLQKWIKAFRESDVATMNKNAFVPCERKESDDEEESEDEEEGEDKKKTKKKSPKGKGKVVNPEASMDSTTLIRQKAPQLYTVACVRTRVSGLELLSGCNNGMELQSL